MISVITLMISTKIFSAIFILEYLITKRNDKMNFTQLRCLIYVADNLSFTIAAQKLNFSQSAISKNISDLEKELNTTLLIRNPHKIALTNDGRYFYHVALNILKEKDSALVNIKNSHQQKNFRDVNIGLEYSPFESKLVTLFLKQFEPGSFNFIVNYLGDYVSQLADGKVDLALVSSDIINNAPEICFDSLLEGHFMIMSAQSSSRLFKSPVHLSDLKNFKLLLPFTDQSYPSIFKLNQILYQKMVTQNIKTVDNYFLMANYVQNTDSMIAILPNFAIDYQQVGFNYFKLDYQVKFSYGLAYLADKKNDPLIIKIRKIFKRIIDLNLQFS